MLGDRIGLASEQGLVDLQTLGLDDRAVDDELVAGAEFDDVVEDDLVRRQRRYRPIAPNRRPGLADDGEPIERAFGADLLDDSDPAVGDDEQAEHPVDDGAGGEDDRQQHPEDRVDPSEHVGLGDLYDGARCPFGYVVGRATGHPFGDLGGAESALDVRRRRLHPCQRRVRRRRSAAGW